MLLRLLMREASHFFNLGPSCYFMKYRNSSFKNVIFCFFFYDYIFFPQGTKCNSGLEFKEIYLLSPTNIYTVTSSAILLYIITTINLKLFKCECGGHWKMSGAISAAG